MLTSVGKLSSIGEMLTIKFAASPPPGERQSSDFDSLLDSFQFGGTVQDIPWFSQLAVAPPASGGDILDLRDLLVGENNGGTVPGNLASFLSFEIAGSNTVIHVSSTGGFASGYVPGNEDQTITLTGVDLVTGFADSNAIITSLLTNNKLITD